MTKKYFRYRVTDITGEPSESFHVGQVLVYSRGRGPTHSECVMDTARGHIVTTVSMEKVGPCWVGPDGKVTTEKPVKGKA